MALITVETVVAGALSIHRSIPDDLHGVQGVLVCGAADGGGEAHQMVQGPVHRYNYALIFKENRISSSKLTKSILRLSLD